MFKILKPIYIGSLENSHHVMVNHLNRITHVNKMSELTVKNQCHLQIIKLMYSSYFNYYTEWQRFVTLVKQSQELKTVSYHKLYDILKQHQNEVNEIRAERLAHTANPLALVAQQQPNQLLVTDDDEMSQAKKNDRTHLALISLSFKKIYKPTNNNLRASSNTSRANQDNSSRINKGIGYDNQRAVNVARAREKKVLDP
ncbi:hypothetical protein Tco_0845827 [Tanacetum coccineum]